MSVWRQVLVRRLRKASGDLQFTPDLAFTGSIMERVTAVREALVRSVRSEFPDVRALGGVVDPLYGALWRARTAREPQ